MTIPPPSVPKSQLTDWRQTEQTVSTPFSTPIVSVTAHTCVYDADHRGLRAATGLDGPWRFFFASRIRLEPPKRPSSLLTTLVRRQVRAAFLDRLSERGFEQIRQSDDESVTIGDNEAVRYRYRARCRLAVDAATLELPVEGYLAVWADEDYHVAGGAFPAGRPTRGPPDLASKLTDHIDPAAAREELLALIDGCGEQ
jgi:hypothetical protein